jgi:hypothetical protein
MWKEFYESINTYKTYYTDYLEFYTLVYFWLLAMLVFYVMLINFALTGKR